MYFSAMCILWISMDFCMFKQLIWLIIMLNHVNMEKQPP